MSIFVKNLEFTPPCFLGWFLLRKVQVGAVDMLPSYSTFHTDSKNVFVCTPPHHYLSHPCHYHLHCHYHHPATTTTPVSTSTPAPTTTCATTSTPPLPPPPPLPLLLPHPPPPPPLPLLLPHPPPPPPLPLSLPPPQPPPPLPICDHHHHNLCHYHTHYHHHPLSPSTVPSVFVVSRGFHHHLEEKTVNSPDYQSLTPKTFILFTKLSILDTKNNHFIYQTINPWHKNNYFIYQTINPWHQKQSFCQTINPWHQKTIILPDFQSLTPSKIDFYHHQLSSNGLIKRLRHQIMTNQKDDH